MVRTLLIFIKSKASLLIVGESGLRPDALRRVRSVLGLFVRF